MYSMNIYKYFAFLLLHKNVLNLFNLQYDLGFSTPYTPVDIDYCVN